MIGYGKVKYLVLAALLACLLWAGAAVAEVDNDDFLYEVNADGTICLLGLSETVCDEALIIPETIDGHTVTSIAEFAFSDIGITSLYIPDTVTMLGEHAFSDCWMMETVQLSENLETIPNSCFEYCYKLKSVTIPASVKQIGEWAFGWSGLESVTFSEGLETIGYGAFENTELRRVALPESLITLGSGVFSDCRELRHVELPSGISAISDYTFYYCKSLERIEIPENIKEIGQWAFYRTGLRNIVLPEGLESVLPYAFRGTKLDCAVIPASAVSLGEYFNEDEYYTEYDAIFSVVDKLYVAAGSAGQAYAEKYDMEYILYGETAPVVAFVSNDDRAAYAVGDSAEWKVNAIGSDELMYFYILYKDGRSISAGWQDESRFTWTFEEEGSYTLKVAVRTPDDYMSEYYWTKTFDAVEELPEKPVVSDFVLYTPENITVDTPIMWSYRVMGGTGSFDENIEDSYHVFINVEDEADLYSLDWQCWAEPGGAFVRASYVPSKPGVYEINFTATDNAGATADTIIFPEITVTDKDFGITGVTSTLNSVTLEAFEDEYDSYPEETILYTHVGEENTWTIQTEGAQGDVIYTAQVMGYTPADGYETVLMQTVTREPEFSFTFRNEAEWSNRVFITAYDPATGAIATYTGDEFQVVPAGENFLPANWYICWEDYYNCVGGTFNVYVDGYEQRFFHLMEQGGFRYGFEIYLDGECVDTSGWIEENEYSYTYTRPGIYTIKASLIDSEGNIYTRETEQVWVGSTAEYLYFDMSAEYSEADRSIVTWSVDFYHDSDECISALCQHLLNRFTLYRDDEAIYTSDWTTEYEYCAELSEVGSYRMQVEMKDGNGVTAYRGISAPIVLSHPRITSIVNGGNHDLGVWTGQYIAWEIYGEGSLRADSNQVYATLYRNGKICKTFGWMDMEAIENYDYGGWHSYARITDAVTAEGIYVLEAQMRDEAGNLSEMYRSGEVYVAGYNEGELRLESVTGDWISIDVNSGKPVTWQAMAIGGKGPHSFSFELWRDGELVEESGWLSTNVYAFIPQQTGAYRVKVTVRDADGNIAGPMTSRGVVVLDSAERTIASLDISANVIYARVGDRFMIEPFIAPENATDKSLSFDSEDDSVIRVDSNGLITVVGEGDAIVTITANDSSGMGINLFIHAGNYGITVPPRDTVLIDAEAFAGSAIEGLDLSGTTGLILAEDALDGSLIKCVYIADDTVISYGAFGDSPAVVFCADAKQVAAAEKAGVDYVNVK